MDYLVAGNWKMNGLTSAEAELEALVEAFAGAAPDHVDVLICPPATLLARFAAKFGTSALIFGGQNCHAETSGAFTGDISAQMLADCGAAHVILGHSERRAGYGESSADVRAKAHAALNAGLKPIICVGETQQQRNAGDALAVVGEQIKSSIPEIAGEYAVAYEPIWAIGTGVTPTIEDIAEMHGNLRTLVPSTVRLLYGGSVKPSNAKEILAVDHVNGALVGGASLKAVDFAGIIKGTPQRG